MKYILTIQTRSKTTEFEITKNSFLNYKDNPKNYNMIFELTNGGIVEVSKDRTVFISVECKAD